MTEQTQNGEADGRPLLEIKDLKKYFSVGRESLKAVDGISLEINKGETFGLVGESGCGKSTAGRVLVRLYEPSGGEVLFGGKNIHEAKGDEGKVLNRKMQMVFQDPQASLNPRMVVGDIVAEGIDIHGLAEGSKERLDRVHELLETVGLSREHAHRYPHEFSGGQRQRIGIARALALEPKLIILDEPVSALDVSVQAQIINLLDDLQERMGLAYLFVAHDLSVVRHVSERIAVMYLGKLMEVSPAEELYTKPIHPYTNALLGAIPVPDPRENRERERIVVSGEPPNPIDPPSGCVFHPRCEWATEACRSVEPPLARYPNGHLAACHHPRNVTAEDLAGAERDPASPLSAGAELPVA